MLGFIPLSSGPISYFDTSGGGFLQDLTFGKIVGVNTLYTPIISQPTLQLAIFTRLQSTTQLYPSSLTLGSSVLTFPKLASTSYIPGFSLGSKFDITVYAPKIPSSNLFSNWNLQIIFDSSPSAIKFTGGSLRSLYSRTVQATTFVRPIYYSQFKFTGNDNRHVFTATLKSFKFERTT